MRNIIIMFYLVFFKMFYYFFSLFPLKKKVTFVTSFGDNCIYLYEEMEKKQVHLKPIFLYKKSCENNIKNLKNVETIKFETLNIISEIKSIYHIATSEFIVVDNYFGFLAAIHFRENVECIQLWHAAGAFKKFGFQDQSFHKRSAIDQKRFSKVYKQFHKIVVGSDNMANIFKKTFNVTETNILPTGIPRTDLFFDEKRKKQIIETLYENNRLLQNKKVIMYAPTFRDNELNQFELHLNLKLMHQFLGDEYVILLRVHPAIKNKKDVENDYPNFVFDYSSYKDVNELLFITDILITDYSSIPFEFALLNRPIIFFAYDVEKYKKERGLWDEFETMIPGPIVTSTEEVISIVQNEDFDFQLISKFSLEWNQYSQGYSSKGLMDYILKRDYVKNVM